MKTFVSKVKNNIIFFACLVSFCSCNGQNSYDPDLMTPDTDEYGRNFGFNYTNLGMLVSYPWEYGGEVNSDTTDFKDFSVKSKISDISKRDLVFELQKNGTIKFWFKSEYKGNIFDTVTQLDGIKSLSKKIIRSDNPIIKKIYTTGKYN